MATPSSHAPPSYSPIPASSRRFKKQLLPSILYSSILLLPLVLVIVNRRPEGVSQVPPEKVSRLISHGGLTFSWTNIMLSWQRTAYHFQPEKNWMNDPNGPLFHKGWYHLFYQYNQDSAIWSNITWGHAVSRDLIHWLHLPCAMLPDQWYDINGVWTGSATILPDGRIMMLYTGNTHDLVQVQCLAYPANLSDPLLLEWVKYPNNPVMIPPPGIGHEDFRDPTTAWRSPGGDKWRITIGSKVNKMGISLVYETADFFKYELLEGYLHEVPGTGMWECIDLYPISLKEANGLDTSANGPDIKHVMKASLFDDGNDYYALGTYDPIENKWTPDDPELDVGVGLRYDYRKYYASKTFYDQNKKRRILWGWIKETDAEELHILKGWACVQSIPRTVLFDPKTGNNILQWPVEEVESLRSDSFEFNVKLEPGSVVPIEVDSGSQLDIVASFELDKEAFEETTEADVGYDCPTSGGSVNRGMLGPFGIIILADENLLELTPIYFYIAKGHNRKVETHFCADELRSSVAADVDKIVYGSKVPVLDGENLTIRSLVDHSIVESFAQGGRRVITSRIYPTKAIDGEARIFLFNNSTGASVAAVETRLHPSRSGR
ncbi:beta-fructofuranosidase, soluble isoenzyme I-like isoform X1 [Sesamum indicum]|uniref:Beta-fructofuranosidase, soluble isoenzyme I-like isoform X1 n=1 Tax=Sesamum indicum TaxID=4182 RepID=A0A8M8USG6_SESIN|nr:beta-fructofuranosidase, soluble isoenzyme I-like isoform X1 [Sesamum indicum]